VYHWPLYRPISDLSTERATKTVDRLLEGSARSNLGRESRGCTHSLRLGEAANGAPLRFACVALDAASLPQPNATATCRKVSSMFGGSVNVKHRTAGSGHLSLAMVTLLADVPPQPNVKRYGSGTSRSAVTTESLIASRSKAARGWQHTSPHAFRDYSPESQG